MHIALIDDEPLQLHTLRETLIAALADQGLEAESIECFPQAADFLAGMAADKYDIIILDIYMNGMNGIDVARKIREMDPHVALAFCTSSNEYAAQSYEAEARYYLQKPILKEKISAMLKRLNLEKIQRDRNIRLPDGHRVPLRHIVYTEYINHSVKFHVRGQEPHTVRASQSEIQELLLPYKGFAMINKGCIVNLAQIKAIQPNAFLMRNGDTVPIARRRFKEIEAAYTRYLFEKMDEEDSD